MWFRSTRTDVELFTPDTKSNGDIYSVCRNGNFTIKSSMEASSRKKRKGLSKGGTQKCTNFLRLERLLLILLIISLATSLTSIGLVLKLYYGTKQSVAREIYIQERLQAENHTVKNITIGEMSTNKSKFHFLISEACSNV